MSPLRKLRLPFLFAVLLGIAYGVDYALTPEAVFASSDHGLTATSTLRWLLAALLTTLGILAVHTVRFFALDPYFLRSQGHRAPALLHAVVAMVLYFVLGLLIASGVFGQSLTGAIATSAVASVVLGLALQETLGNFFAGISLQVEQPFRLGDVIRADGMEGRVEAFNWRAATIRTVDDSQIVIPNSLIAREAVEVFARGKSVRRRLMIPAPYGLQPQTLNRVVRNALVAVPGVSDGPPVQVRLATFDDSSIGYEILYWVDDYFNIAGVDAIVRERVWYAFARENISIPYPHEVQVAYVPPPPAQEDPVDERARWLGEVDLFAPLAPEERQRLAAGARTLLYAPGETILRSGAEGGSMFVVLRGRVEIRLAKEDGCRVTVAEISSGEVIGEMSLLTGDPRSADARALDEVELIEVRRAEMKSLLASNERLAEAFAAEASLRLDQRADALAEADTEEEGPMTEASLLQRIQRFFDLT